LKPVQSAGPPERSVASARQALVKMPADDHGVDAPSLHPADAPRAVGRTYAAGRPRAVLVGVDIGRSSRFDATLDELALLAESAGDEVVGRVIARRATPDAALFVGSGKADEVKLLVQALSAEVVVFDQALSPAQQRNLERYLGVSVADRTMLILEIFAARAQSHEGKLQVELARLQYLATRLVRRWSHLERQQGGIGTRGGPGEAQIELDKRMIGERIKAVRARLEKVKRQRNTQRRQRERNQTFRVSLVGYTNAGKSTLFNALTKAQAYAADQLFATLDTTTRQLYLEDAGLSVSLSDTVGFIRDLPHKLVEAFEATLQEATHADLLLHVVDCASDVAHEQMTEVQRVLASIGADRVSQLVVFNKVDCLELDQRPRVALNALEHEGRVLPRIFVSARGGEGLDDLRRLLGECAKRVRSTAGAATEAPTAAHELPLQCQQAVDLLFPPNWIVMASQQSVDSSEI
jgi:GTP-binding protein HflX